MIQTIPSAITTLFLAVFVSFVSLMYKRPIMLGFNARYKSKH